MVPQTDGRGCSSWLARVLPNVDRLLMVRQQYPSMICEQFVQVLEENLGKKARFLHFKRTSREEKMRVDKILID